MITEYIRNGTMEVWEGERPRGAWIDMRRKSDGFLVKNAHVAGWVMRHVKDYYQHQYVYNRTDGVIEKGTIWNKKTIGQ